MRYRRLLATLSLGPPSPVSPSDLLPQTSELSGHVLGKRKVPECEPHPELAGEIGVLRRTKRMVHGSCDPPFSDTVVSPQVASDGSATDPVQHDTSSIPWNASGFASVESDNAYLDQLEREGILDHEENVRGLHGDAGAQAAHSEDTMSTTTVDSTTLSQDDFLRHADDHQARLNDVYGIDEVQVDISGK